MALQGSIHEFGLADIFQLIGIQRKTGTLVLEGDEGRVSVKFLNGTVVEAASKESTVEDLLGAVLVRTGKISDKQLSDALKTQERTLQRLGHILVDDGLIDEQELIEGLRVQALQIIYRLFRWRAGGYKFEVSADVEYDDRHFSPIDAETILMEGARMIDEWPLIERRIHSDGMVLRTAGEAVEMVSVADPTADELRLDEPVDAFGDALGSELDLAFGEPAEAPESEPDIGPQLTDEERMILKLVDGQNNVQWISDHSPLSQFDTYRILADLVTRQLLEEVESIQSQQAGPSRPWLEHVLAAVLAFGIVVGVVVSVWLLPANGAAPWRVASPTTTDELRFYASLSRLERLQGALRIYYLDNGSFPVTLAPLAAERYVRPTDLLDPWGRGYGYRLATSGYELYGLDGSGGRPPELAISYQFTPSQLLILSEGPGGQP